MVRILHLIEQLTRGGAGRALLGVARYAGAFHHTIGTLRPPEEGARQMAAEFGIEIVQPEPADFEAADIVHVHFWNSPLLYATLGRPWPATRVLTWCHVGGNEAPQVLIPGLVEFSDVMLASNPHTAELPVMAAANAQGKGGIVLGSPDFSRLRSGRPRTDRRFTIAYIGTVDFVKMHPDFVALHASLAIDDYRVVVCGDGAALAVLRRQAAEAGCPDRFEFRGYVEAIDDVLAESDVFGYPIGDGYASELVLQEAMYCGVPPVVMARGGPSRMVVHEDTGLLARKPAEYRAALERLAHDPQLRAAMGARASAYATQHWGAQRSAAQMTVWYDELMSAPKHLRNPVGGDGTRSGADRFVLGLGPAASQFRVSKDDDAFPRATLLAADRLISASGPLLASAASGGVLHYRLQYPDDPHLRFWSGLVLQGAGRPALAAAEFAAAARAGLDASRPGHDSPSNPAPRPDFLVPRAGWQSLVGRLRARPCTVAVLGTSVAAQNDGYVAGLQRWIDDWTGHRHQSVNAGYGGVASFGAVFLMQRHVVPRRPDVCFVECTTGDMASSVVQSEVAPVVEGILRKLRALDCSVCFLHLYRDGQDAGLGASVLERYESLAEYYGVPSLHIGRALTDAIEAGSLDRDRLFRDKIHTRPEGAFSVVRLIGQALASTQVPPQALEECATENRPTEAIALPSPLQAGHYGGAAITPVSADMVVDGRPVPTGNFRFLHPYLDIAQGRTLRIPAGPDDLCGLLLIVGPHCGPVLVRSGDSARPYDTEDEWTYFDRLHTLPLAAPLPRKHPIDISPLRGSLKIAGLLIRPGIDQVRTLP